MFQKRSRQRVRRSLSVAPRSKRHIREKASVPGGRTNGNGRTRRSQTSNSRKSIKHRSDP